MESTSNKVIPLVSKNELENKKDGNNDSNGIIDSFINTALKVINFLIESQDVPIHQNTKPAIEEKKKDIKPPEPTEKCLICINNCKKSIMNEFVLSCNHQCCKECFFQFIKDKINKGEVSEIHCFCFKCKVIISEQIIRSVIKENKTLCDKYDKFKTRDLVMSSEDKKFCPEQNCNSYLEWRKGQNINVECKNGHKYCFKCLNKWHDYKPCGEEIDKSFQLWSKEHVVKKCPYCKYLTLKGDRCNHMTCPVCKAHWCWLCGKIMDSSSHLERGGTCAGQYFSDKNEPNPIIAEQYSYDGPTYFNELDRPAVRYPSPYDIKYNSKPKFVDNPESKKNRMAQINLIVNGEHNESDACCESFVNSEFLCRPPSQCCRNIYATFIYFFCFFSFALKISYILSFIDITVVNHTVEYSVWSSSMKRQTRAFVNIISVFIRLILLFPYMIPGFFFAVLKFLLNLGEENRPYNFLFVMYNKINKEKKKKSNEIEN